MKKVFMVFFKAEQKKSKKEKKRQKSIKIETEKKIKKWWEDKVGKKKYGNLFRC